MILLITLMHAVVLWVLEFFLYPELLIYPYLTTSGFLPYKNILDQHFPGLMFFPVNFYSLGFTDPTSFKLLLILIVSVQSLIIYKIGKNLGGKIVGLLASIAYLIWQPFFEGNQLWLDIFLPLFTLPAFWFFSKKKWFLTGLFLGLGIVFKQTQVPLVAFVGLCILLQTRSWQKIIKFSLGSLLPSVLMLVYLGNIGVLSDFWYWTVTFNLSEFATGGSLAPRLVDLVKLTLPLGIVALAVWKVKQTRLIALWMLFTVIGGIARFGFIHLQPAVPYFSLVTAFLVYNLWQTKSKLLLAGILLLTLTWLGYFYSRQTGFLNFKFLDEHNLLIISEVEERTDPGDKIFLLGVHPHIYVLSKTLPPGDMFIFQFPWFFNVAGERVLDSMIKDPPQVIVYDDASNIDGQHMRNYGLFLLEHIRHNYVLEEKHGTIEIYERRN